MHTECGGHDFISAEDRYMIWLKKIQYEYNSAKFYSHTFDGWRSNEFKHFIKRMTMCQIQMKNEKGE